MDAATQTLTATTPDLSHAGLRDIGQVYYNLSRAELYEHTVKRGEGYISNAGALMCDTGKTTGRSPKNKFVIDTPSVHDLIDWDSDFNNPKDLATWTNWRAKVLSYLEGNDVYVTDVFAGAEPKYRIGVRVISNALSRRCSPRTSSSASTRRSDRSSTSPEWTVIFTPGLKATAEDGAEGVLVLVNSTRRPSLPAATEYAGEIKKGIFGVMSVLMRSRRMNRHCSGQHCPERQERRVLRPQRHRQDSLSADPERQLIGDDEHGWHDGGVFKLRRRCYARRSTSSPEASPRSGRHATCSGRCSRTSASTSATRAVDYSDVSKTRTRAAAMTSASSRTSARPARSAARDVVF